MSFRHKELTFLHFVFTLLLSFPRFCLQLSVTTISLTEIPHLPTDSSTFLTGRWLFGIQSTLLILCMVKLWIPLLFSKQCCMAGRTSCFPRRKVNSNVYITSGFKDLASRTFEFVRMVSSKNARVFTDHQRDLKYED